MCLLVQLSFNKALHPEEHHAIYIYNKHTESIAKAIQVPHRPHQIEICNHYFGALFNKEHLELLRPLIVFLFHYLMFQTWSVTLHKEAYYQLSFIYKSIAEKSPENEFWTKGNNSWKSRSTVTKVELVL